MLGTVEEVDRNNCKELQLHSASNSSNLIHTLEKCLKELKNYSPGDRTKNETVDRRVSAASWVRSQLRALRLIYFPLQFLTSTLAGLK